MILKDSAGSLVKVAVDGDYDNLEIISAEYLDTGLDVLDDELEYILEHNYDLLCASINQDV